MNLEGPRLEKYLYGSESGQSSRGDPSRGYHFLHEIAAVVAVDEVLLPLSFSTDVLSRLRFDPDLYIQVIKRI